MWMFDQDKRQDRRDVADLTELLKAQLKALGEGRYELTLRTRDDQVSYAHVSAADILDRVRDLRAVNMAGTDIAIRPAARTGLVLLRDVPAARIGDLRGDGFPPVLLTEPRPERFDAWVRLDTMGIQRGLHDSMAQVIAARYGGDTRTAGAEQAAPLAGFTTRDDPDRRVPLVSADRESRMAPAALDLADWVLERVSLTWEIVAEQRWRNVPLEHARVEAERVAAADKPEEPARDGGVPAPTPTSSGRCAGRSSTAARAGSTNGRPSGARRTNSWIRTPRSRSTSSRTPSTRAGRPARDRAARRPRGRSTSRGRPRRCWPPRSPRRAKVRNQHAARNGHGRRGGPWPLSVAVERRPLTPGQPHTARKAS